MLADALLLTVSTTEDDPGMMMLETTSPLSGRPVHLVTADASWAGMMSASGAVVAMDAVGRGDTLLMAMTWPSGDVEGVLVGVDSAMDGTASFPSLSPAECIGQR